MFQKVKCVVLKRKKRSDDRSGDGTDLDEVKINNKFDI